VLYTEGAEKVPYKIVFTEVLLKKLKEDFGEQIVTII